MQKAAFLLSFSLFFLATVAGQEGFQIRAKFQFYHYDTLWFGKTTGKKAVPEFFALRNADDTYDLSSADPLPSGNYAIILRRAPNANFSYIQCWLADGQRHFSMELNANKPYENSKITGSPENEIFYRYLTQFYALDHKLDSLVEVWRFKQDEASWRNRVAAEEELARFQEDFIKRNPGTLSAGLVQQVLFTSPPASASKSGSWQAEAAARWQFQRQHWFDRTNLASDDFLRYPQWVDRTDFYLFHLPPPDPDTVKVLLDDVFSRMSSNFTNLQYYFKYVVNSLGRMSQFRLDEAFVHVVHNYIQTGKAPGTKQEDVQKMVNDAARMEPLFVGKKASNLLLFDRQNQPVTLLAQTAPMILLVFWQPDCSHCKREMPLLKNISERYKDKGLRVMAVCGKSGDETADCWKFVDEQSLPADWLLLADPQRRSGMANLFNLRTFPRLFLLDENKNIVWKRAGEASEMEIEAAIGKANVQK